MPAEVLVDSRPNNGMEPPAPSLSFLDADQAAALNGLVEVVGDVVNDMNDAGEQLPLPFIEKSYSGTIYVRTSAEVHRRLVMEAAENHVELNQWAAQSFIFSARKL